MFDDHFSDLERGSIPHILVFEIVPIVILFDKFGISEVGDMLPDISISIFVGLVKVVKVNG